VIQKGSLDARQFRLRDEKTMKTSRTHRFTMLLVLALTAIAVFAVQAPAKNSASAKDKNGNGIKDAWEKANGLSTKKDQGNRDADGDGSRNRCEYQAKTDPNVADSNGDGVVDGDADSDGDGATDRAESNLRSNCGRANSHRRIRRATVTSLTDGVLVLTVRGGGTVTAPVAENLRCSTKAKASAAKSKGKAKTPACTVTDLVAGVKVHKARTKGSKFVEITLLP
jgi:hypothetical protein